MSGLSGSTGKSGISGMSGTSGTSGASPTIIILGTVVFSPNVDKSFAETHPIITKNNINKDVIIIFRLNLIFFTSF